MRPRLPARGLALGLAGLAACAGSPDPDPRFEPTRGVLETVAVLRRHVPDDTYRFEPARDFTGRNVYRASLLRLENLEALHAEALAAGHLDDVIAFAKARSLERIRAFDLAAASYRRAARSEGPLRDEARAGAALCDALAEASALTRPDEIPRRLALLRALREAHPDDHHQFVIQEEIERADVDEALHRTSVRRIEEDGDVRALAALQRVVMSHRESRHANRHLLRLAELYETLAREYVEAHPPEGLRFDPPAFEELVDATARLYEAVANQDGATERIEAAQRLESFVAFTLRVDRDRFSR